MKYCSKCGAENLETDSFCKKCGSRLTQDAGTTWNASPGRSVPTRQSSGNPVVDMLKTQGSSGKCLAAALFFSAMFLFQLIHAFQGVHAYDQNGLLEKIEGLTGNLGLSPLVGPYYDFINSAVVGLNLLALVPTIFFFIGIWLLYLSCSDRSTAGVTTTGATIIKVVTIVQLVLACVILLAVEAALIAAAVKTPGGNTVMTILAVLAAGVGTLFLLYYASILSILGSVKEAALVGKAGKVHLAAYLGVVNFILAVFSVIGGAMSGNAVEFFSDVFCAAFLILASLIVFTYRDSMRRLRSFPAAAASAVPAPQGAEANR